MRNDRIISQLDRLAERHPELAQARSLIEADLLPNKAFLKSIYEGDLPPSKSTLLVRTILEDPFLYRIKPEPPSVALQKRIVLFLMNNPRKLLDPFAPTALRGDVPNFLCAHRGIRRPTLRDVMKTYVFEPFFDDKTPDKVMGLLEDCVRSTMLDDASAERLLTSRMTGKIARRFFETGSRIVDVRNALFMADKLLNAEGHGGRLQSKIPLSMSSCLRIPRVSIPALMALCDVLALNVCGAVTIDDEDVENSEVAELIRFAAIHTNALDIETIALRHVERHFMTDTSAQAMLDRLNEGVRQSIYLSGLLFNAPRLYAKDDLPEPFTEAGAILSSGDKQSFMRLCEKHYNRVDEEFGARVYALVRPDDTLLDARSRINIAFYAWYLLSKGEEPVEHLPSVAKYFLGLPEYEPCRSPTKSSRRSKKSVKRHEAALPGLEELLTSLEAPVAYLVLPGYYGEIPDDGPVFLHKAFASAYGNLPKQVQLIGDGTLRFGEALTIDSKLQNRYHWVELGPPANPT